MSDNTNYQPNQESTQADFSSAASSAWEARQVVKARVNMRIDAPTPEQTEKMTNEAARDARKCYVSNWKIQRNADGTINCLKTDGDKTVHLRKDNLGDNTVGYSFRRQLGKAASGGDVILEDRMVMHNNTVALEDSMIWDTKNPQRPYTYLREVVASDKNIYVAENTARAYSKALENAPEHHFLVDKITKLNNILGKKGVAQMGYEIKETQGIQSAAPVSTEFTGVMPALGNMRQFQEYKQTMPGGTYPQLAQGSRYIAEEAQVADYRRSQQMSQQGYNPGFTQGQTTEQLQVQGYRHDGFNPGFTQGQTTEQLPVADYHRNPVEGFNPSFTRGRTTEQLQVRDYRRNPLAGFNPGFTRGRTTEHLQVRDYRRNPVPGFDPGFTRGSTCDHIPLNGNMRVDNDPFRKPFRPIQNRPEPVKQEAPKEVKKYIPQVTEQPLEPKPVPTQPAGAEGETGNIVNTKLHGEVLPFKKPGEK